MCDFLRDFCGRLSGQRGIEAGDGRAEVFGREVGVAHHHRQRRVPEQVLHLLERSAALDRPGREGVPQIMKVEIVQLGALDGSNPGRPIVIPPAAEED